MRNYTIETEEDTYTSESKPCGNSICSTTTISDDESESESEISSETPTTMRRNVSFGNIKIREFNRVVGDHPDVRVGVPVSIGWDYIENESIPIDLYESKRTMKKNLRMSSITRKNILHHVFDISEEEIRNAEKEVQRIKKQRQYSLKPNKITQASKRVKRSWKNMLKGLASASSTSSSIHSGYIFPVIR